MMTQGQLNQLRQLLDAHIDVGINELGYGEKFDNHLGLSAAENLAQILAKGVDEDTSQLDLNDPEEVIIDG